MIAIFRIRMHCSIGGCHQWRSTIAYILMQSRGQYFVCRIYIEEVRISISERGSWLNIFSQGKHSLFFQKKIHQNRIFNSNRKDYMIMTFILFNHHDMIKKIFSMYISVIRTNFLPIYLRRWIKIKLTDDDDDGDRAWLASVLINSRRLLFFCFISI